MGEVKVYGLTTCPHCKKVIDLLEKLKVEYEVTWLDRLGGEERKKAIEEVHRISGSYAVPVVVKGEKWVLGYNPEKLKKLLSG
jgi:glutaredoxin